MAAKALDDREALPSRSQIKVGKRGAPQAFAQKLYQILEVESTDHIAWNDTGSAFNIVNMEVFTEQILMKYFRHQKFLSFTRQLNLYGFRKVITCGPDEWAYEHKCFLRDRPDLLDFVRRTLAPASKGKVPAPEEEAANVRRKLAPASKGKVPAPEEEAAKEQPPTAQAPASKVKVPVPEEEAAKEQPPTSQQIQLPGKTLQKACEEEMQRAQIIIDKLDTPVEVKVKFQKVQELLRRNSQLIADIEQRHQHASSSFNTPQHELGQAGQLIQELNSNLTEVVKIYASFSHIEEHAS
eukprot:CAMPEP_0206378756 /NCGR_PEP_ID=MMETSP0294-20121207/10928_1 /ASSEMBLY_ACC=CAM_ASM_000327 /TAXON_ID=39354 /ORGANISM="Heterosigma akashiwo, Strain CCMP2393" /LENGTH=295 /DNA_ID=CAMNT_0053827455 /DNA_START=75 /DNA_END=962 /DNA_ORIENTATION=+